ncbi:hypothetical protein ACHAW6_001770 [Cyclotella cf. meneghiniana]
MEKSSSEGRGTQPLVYDTREFTCQQYLSTHKCSNTKNLITFNYTTMGYLRISTAIDKGYFQGWNGLTSDKVQKFITPSQESEKGHMDQQ